MVVVARIPEELLIQQRDVRALEVGMRDVDSRVDDRQRDACRQGWRGVGADRCAPPLGGPQRIGETDGQEHGAAERDADGRRLWEKPLGKKGPPAAADDSAAMPPVPVSKDATGQSGIQLDLTG